MLSFANLIVAAAIALALGCAERRPTGTPTGEEGGVSSGESLSPAAIFPHADGWKSPASHGVWVQQYGNNACLKCHKISSEKKEIPPTCTSCHSLYPHPTGWVKKEGHGAKVLTDGKATCATQCHGSDLKGGLSGRSCQSCHSIYPHTPTWGNPAEHGEVAKGDGRTTCQGCHGKDLKGGSSGISCQKCHAIYPHPTGWVKKENHGAKVLTDGKATCATQCHGSDLKGGLSGRSCQSCHSIYPHTPTWRNPAEHGEVAKGDGRTTCQGCHGKDLKGGSSGISCYTCHAIYPHDVEWIDPKRHGAEVKASGKEGCKTSCHGTDLKGGLSGISCNSCHKLYPHSGKWSSEHGGTFKLLGRNACTGCHGKDLEKTLAGKSCISCHDYPHPPPEKWLPYSGGHGERIKKSGGEIASCKFCHGDDLKKIQGGKNCFSCHPSYPHKGVTAGWSKYEGHGKYALAAEKRLECQICHGTDYKGGGRGNRSCYSCHDNYPHPFDWKKTGHGPVVWKTGSTSCATAACHGEGLIPKVGVTEGTACAGCHKTYPHSPDWISAPAPGVSRHGTEARTDIANCKTCHGKDLNRAPAGYKSCQSCHPAWLSHKTAKRSDLPEGYWTSPEGHGKYLKDKGWDRGECQTCHGKDDGGGIALVSCNSCHPSFPQKHTGSWKGKGAGSHGDFIHTDLKEDLTSCKLCHGSDLKGGNVGKGCFSCHADYPHSALTDWSTTGHGPRSVASADRDRCKVCHGSALETPKGGKTCVSCHTEFPHPADWSKVQSRTESIGCGEWDTPPCTAAKTYRNLHGQRFLEQKKAGFPDSPNKCAGCHGVDYKGGASKVACGSCHASYPHIVEPKWVDKGGEIQGHGKAYLDHTKKGFSSPCASCHVRLGEGLDSLGGGGGKAPACASCHFEYPHLHPPDVSSGEDWSGASRHGYRFITGELFEAIDPKKRNRCQDCHGPDLLGKGATIKSCTGCHHHGSVSHDKCCKVSVSKGPSNWRKATAHGGVYLEELYEGTSFAGRCGKCHAATSKRDPKVCNPLIGDRNPDACNECHKSPPVPCSTVPCGGMDPVTGACP